MWVRGHLREGVSWLEPAIVAEGVSEQPRIMGLGAAAMLLGALGRSDEASAYAAEMLVAARQAGDRSEIARAMTLQGIEALRGGDRAQARPLFEEALAEALAANDAMLIGNALVNLGQAVPQQAESLCRRALALFEGEGDVWGIAYASSNIACILRDRGELGEAVERFSDAIRLLTNLGDRFYLVFAIEDLARTRADSRRAETAVRLFSAAHALRSATGALLSPGVRPDYERRLRQLASSLGRASFDAAWASGMRLPLETLVDEASVAPAAAAGAAKRQIAGPGGALTPRERDVARLVGRGLSNREIAKTLGITVGTAGVHLEHILRKLDMRSRHQVADWMQAQGLVGD